MIHSDVEQRTPEWHLMRATRVGGSQANAVVSRSRNGKEAVGRRDLRVTMALARLGYPPAVDTYTNADMARGVALEPVAIRAWEMMSGLSADTVGYCTSESEPYAGCSPDAIVGEDGVLEVKAPRAALHLAYIQLGRKATPEGWGLLSVPPQYRPQVLHTLLITGREWLEWVSYCDAFPFSAQVLCVHIPRDETITQIEQYGEALRSFLVDVDSTVSDIKLIVESSHDHGPAPSYP
jgi:hypothetical protein